MRKRFFFSYDNKSIHSHAVHMFRGKMFFLLQLTFILRGHT
jgi:hypothetical protein